jgi:hypothetical protein
MIAELALTPEILPFFLGLARARRWIPSGRLPFGRDVGATGVISGMGAGWGTKEFGLCVTAEVSGNVSLRFGDGRAASAVAVKGDDATSFRLDRTAVLGPFPFGETCS